MGTHDDDLREIFSSFVSEGLKQKEDALSPEDVAWVESCLVKDLGGTDDNWDDVKDALWNIISSQESSPSEASDKTLEVNNESVQVDDDKSEVTSLPDFMQDSFSCNPSPVKENGDDEANVAGLLRDHVSYNHINLEESEDGEAKMAAASVEDTGSPESIFRVWDLGTQFEVDELTKQLTTALAESSVGSALDGATSNEIIFEDLLAGMADLSLHPRT